MQFVLKILTDPGRRSDLPALCAGILITLSLAPFKAWPLAILAITLFALSLQNTTPKQAVWRGWVFGAGLFGSGASWVYVSIHLHGHAPIPLATLLTTIYCGGLALCISLVSYFYVRFFRNDNAGLLLALPTLWVLGEWFRCWFLTGFPWLFLGYGQVDGPLSGWAPIIGTLGISWLLAFTGCGLARLALKPDHTAQLILGALILFWLVSPGLQPINWVTPRDNGRLTVASIQANIPQEEKWRPEQLQPTLQLYRSMSEQLWENDLIIWPETAIPRVYHRARGFISQMDAAAKKHNTAIISGIPYKEPASNQYYNSIIAFGNAEGIYHKKRLVPFGEYIPLEDWLRGVIEFFDLPMSNFSVGPDSGAPLTVKGFQLAAFICYEVVYPNLVANTAPQADFFLTISNDTWFGKSHGPLQHFEMARMRALENGRQLIRGTNNGVSALVDEKGRVIKRIEQYTQGTLQGEVVAMQGTTPFSRWGHTPVIIAALMLLASLLLWRRQTKQ